MDHAGDPLIGRVLDGRYRVGPKIARGGMATVYEAIDQRLERTVAIKVMHAGLAGDPEFVARFEREARSAARLAHNNVVAVFDQGDDNGTLFLVMEYVPGTTLRDLIRSEAPLSPGRALSLLEPVLSALAAAHGAGMIHRDVKPENVLLGDSGEIKVADFGLARAVNTETQHTATGGVLIGTVSYLSPELVVDGKADARADVYAAGVLLFEMLTGRKPHQADSPIQVAYKHVHEDIPNPSTLTPGLPAYVDALVARATARDMTLRPTDARVLLHQVRRVRNALDHGVREDAQLTADLAPARAVGAAGVASAGTGTGTGELPRQIIDPSAPGAAAAIEQAHAHSDAFGDYADMFEESEAQTGPVGTASPAAFEGGDDFTAPVRRQPRAYSAPTTTSAAAPAVVPPGRTPEIDQSYLPPHRRTRLRRGPALILGLLIAAILVGVGGWYFGIARYTVTPGIIDLPTIAAKARVEQAGLHFHIGSKEFSETVAKDAVISTDPQAGSKIRKNGTVNAVVSKGPERHDVPKVAGMTVDEAQAALQDAHLSFGVLVPRYDDKVAKDIVINADPRPGTPQKRDAAINLIVSRGPRPIKIPDFVGKPVDEATRTLSKLGFKVDSSLEKYDDKVPAGNVLTQSPHSGAGKKGDEIVLVVSKGPEVVTVPDVRRMTASDAKSLLEGQRFTVKSRKSGFYIGLDRVANTNPSPGASVRKGSTVTLELV